MRTFITILALPTLVSAFTKPSIGKFGAPKPNIMSFPPCLKDSTVFDTTCDKVVNKGEALLEKIDSHVGKRVFSGLDHIPILVTLKGLGEAAGSTNFGVDAAASAFTSGPAAALTIPGYFYKIWPLIAICQLASVARSTLSETSELSQGEITTIAVANFAATKALVSGNFSWLFVTALLSSYPNRNGANSKLELHNSSLQLMSSFTTIAALFATVTKVTSYIPILAGKSEVASLIALVGYYALVNRTGNVTVKKAINATIIGGIFWARIAAGGLNFSGGINSILSMSTVTLASTAAVFYFAAQKAKAALS